MHPACGIKCTFFALQAKSDEISLGAYLKREKFMAHESVRKLRLIEKQIPSLQDEGSLLAFFAKSGERVLDESRSALHDALDRLEKLVEKSE